MKEMHREIQEDEQNRYTMGFLLFVLILLVSVLAISAKAVLAMFGS
jgi:hypothetical protein